MRAKQCWETEGFLTNASLAFLGVTSISPCNQESSVLPSVWHLEKAQLKMADLRTTVSWFRECLFRALSVSPLGFLCCDSALPRGTESPPPPPRMLFSAPWTDWPWPWVAGGFGRASCSSDCGTAAGASRTHELHLGMSPTAAVSPSPQNRLLSRRAHPGG